MISSTSRRKRMRRLSSLGAHALRVQAARPSSSQWQVLHPSSAINVVLGVQLAPETARFSRCGHVLLVQNQPIPLFAHRQRLQSCILISLGVQTCPLVWRCTSSFSSVDDNESPFWTCSVRTCASSESSFGGHILRVQAFWPSLLQRHLLQSSMNVVPGTHFSSHSAPTTNVANAKTSIFIV